MTINSIIDFELEDFITNTMFPGYLAGYFNGTFAHGEELLLKEIFLEVEKFNKSEQREYAYRKILFILDEMQFIPEQKTNGIENEVNKIQLFDRSLQKVKNGIILKLEDLNSNLGEEILSSKEFEELKNKIDQIAQTLFEFIKTQNATNEVIYNSVEEIKIDLLNTVNKNKIFGKEQVYQALSGKLIDMSIKGGAKAMISYFPDKVNSLKEYLVGLL